MFTLIYSPKAHLVCGANKAVTTNGDEVIYTCMTDEDDGPWAESYKWKDATVVGYCLGYDDITDFDV